jgi:hypothetical protein
MFTHNEFVNALASMDNVLFEQTVCQSLNEESVVQTHSDDLQNLGTSEQIQEPTFDWNADDLTAILCQANRSLAATPNLGYDIASSNDLQQSQVTVNIARYDAVVLPVEEDYAPHSDGHPQIYDPIVNTLTNGQMIEAAAPLQDVTLAVANTTAESTPERKRKKKRIELPWTTSESAILLSFAQVFTDLDDRWNWLLDNHSDKFNKDRNMASLYKDKVATVLYRLRTSMLTETLAANKKSILAMIRTSEFQSQFKSSKKEWAHEKALMLANGTYFRSTKTKPKSFKLEKFF